MNLNRLLIEVQPTFFNAVLVDSHHFNRITKQGKDYFPCCHHYSDVDEIASVLSEILDCVANKSYDTDRIIFCHPLSMELYGFNALRLAVEKCGFPQQNVRFCTFMRSDALCFARKGYVKEKDLFIVVREQGEMVEGQIFLYEDGTLEDVDMAVVEREETDKMIETIGEESKWLAENPDEIRVFRSVEKSKQWNDRNPTEMMKVLCGHQNTIFFQSNTIYGAAENEMCYLQNNGYILCLANTPFSCSIIGEKIINDTITPDKATIPIRSKSKVKKGGQCRWTSHCKNC